MQPSDGLFAGGPGRRRGCQAYLLLPGGELDGRCVRRTIRRKAFDRCVATTQDAKGTSITLSINHEFRWGVAGLSNSSWNFIKGAALGLMLRIGQEGSRSTKTRRATHRSVLELQVKDPIALFLEIA